MRFPVLSQVIGVCLHLKMQHYLTGRAAKTKAVLPETKDLGG